MTIISEVSGLLENVIYQGIWKMDTWTSLFLRRKH